MKSRSVKLREAHKPPPDGRASFSSVLWDNQALHLVTASSSDPAISVHDPLLPSDAPKVFCHHRDGVTSLAISPNSTCLASGSTDRSVKLYKFPSGEFQTNITRFTLPIRTLAFNKSGSMLAAAGDDEGIKLINTIDGSIARVLKGHKGSITCLAFDPIGEYLASVDSIGTVIYWELQSGMILHTLKGASPNCGFDYSVINVLCWSPDGETLAVPGLKNDVVMYDRDTAEKLFSLRGDHSEPVCFLTWSPNGKYLATSALDRQVLIWDVDKKQDIDRQKFDENICCMAWKPIGNALAVIDTIGKYGVWEAVIPSSMKSPVEGIPNSRLKYGNGLLLYDDDDNDEELNAHGSISDASDDSYSESGMPSQKRLRKTSHGEYWEEEGFDELSSPPKLKSQKGCQKVIPDDRKEGSLRTEPSTRSRMQVAFQPGSTPVQLGKRHFLCYNMIGCITSMEQEGYSHVEIDFHDTSKGPRVPSMTDHFGFTMASINETGSVFGNPCKGDKNLSTLMYRPFCSWASNSEWSMRFEGEEVKAVALGAGWVAAVTSLNFLRIFTRGGLQENQTPRPVTPEHILHLGIQPDITRLNILNEYRNFAWLKYLAYLHSPVHVTQQVGYVQGGWKSWDRYILSLDGPVVTASGFKDELAVITHASDCLSSGDQVMNLCVFNISSCTKSFEGRLPLSPGSQLQWLGFSEEGFLGFYDSKGFLRLYTTQYGGSWVPIFSATKVKKSDENYWMVGFNANNIFCIVCNSPDSFPQVTPKPVLTLLNFSVPLASSDIGAEAFENEFMLNYICLSQMHKRIDEATQGGLNAASLDDDAFNIESAQDKCILRLIASCCNSDKLARAAELVKLLSLEKSVRGAIKLATILKLPNLAERFNFILEERMLNEKESASRDNVPRVSSDFVIDTTAPAIVRGASVAAGTPSTMPALSAPLFMKKARENNEVDYKRTDPGPSAWVGECVGTRTNEFAGHGDKIQESAPSRKPEHMLESNAKRPSHSLLKPTKGLEKKSTVEGQQQLPRPSNPFLKGSVK